MQVYQRQEEYSAALHLEQGTQARPAAGAMGWLTDAVNVVAADGGARGERRRRGEEAADAEAQQQRRKRRPHWLLGHRC